jgi:hypothetical protein
VSLASVEAAIESELPRLPGWCTTAKGKRLAALAEGAALCVELGVYGGRSLVAVGLALQDQGRGRLDGVDPYAVEAALEGDNGPAVDAVWQATAFASVERAARSAVERLGLGDRVRFVRARSLDAVRDYADGSVDLLHQDSNHSELVSCREVVAWAPKLRPGGLWVFDDSDWATTRAAQRLLLERGFTEQEDHYLWRVFRAPGLALAATDRRQAPGPLVDPHDEHHERPKESLREGQPVHPEELSAPALD